MTKSERNLTVMQWCKTQFLSGTLSYNNVSNGLQITDRTGSSMILTADDGKNIYEITAGGKKQLAVWQGYDWFTFQYN